MLPANLTSRIYCIGLGPRGNPRCQIKVPLGSPEAAEIARGWLAKGFINGVGRGKTLYPLSVTVEKGSIVANRFGDVARLAIALGWPMAVCEPLSALAETKQPPGELSRLGTREKRLELVGRVKIAVRAYAALVKRRVDGTR